MKHPLFSPIKGLYFYLLAWVMMTIVHTVIVYSYSPAGFLLSFLDALLFNSIFAGFGLGIWYAVRFQKLKAHTWRKILLSHLTNISAFLLVWIFLSSVFLKNLSPNEAYSLFLHQSTPFRFLAGLLYYLVIVLFYYSYSYYTSYKENLVKSAELKTMVREVQLELLKSQLNPHFIFNCLNSISALTMLDAAKAQEMIIKLSTFLRYSLTQKPDSLISFKEETDNAIIYLDIEKMRLGERLKVVTNIAKESLEIKVPVMILQPLLENAVKHGAYESLDKVTINLSSKVEKEHLIVAITNNYEGTGNPGGKGIGLKNVSGRLRLLYDVRAMINISGDGNIFKVILYIPVNNE